ncbi:unnamed protein product [Ceratitis capitata]|uniref:(Mediterranean fruit fly) hypothetical protein n=1 Tax=Ceratitis capitata TaxID=7213 RepID=A0A811VBZ9_CERCA|nr:unnamed protein product [Ceratitis capitata]
MRFIKKIFSIKKPSSNGNSTPQPHDQLLQKNSFFRIFSLHRPFTSILLLCPPTCFLFHSFHLHAGKLTFESTPTFSLLQLGFVWKTDKMKKKEKVGHRSEVAGTEAGSTICSNIFTYIDLLVRF